MTNINTACVKNNASYQLNNALPNKETISSNFCERLAQWGNKSLNNGEERAIAVERIKRLTIRTWHLLICHILI